MNITWQTYCLSLVVFDYFKKKKKLKTNYSAFEVSHFNLKTEDPSEKMGTTLGYSLSSLAANCYIMGLYLKTESIKDTHLATMKTTGMSLFSYYFLL